jgi:hypothetical protein
MEWVMVLFFKKETKKEKKEKRKLWAGQPPTWLGWPATLL